MPRKRPLTPSYDEAFQKYIEEHELPIVAAKQEQSQIIVKRLLKRRTEEELYAAEQHIAPIVVSGAEVDNALERFLNNSPMPTSIVPWEKHEILALAAMLLCEKAEQRSRESDSADRNTEVDHFVPWAHAQVEHLVDVATIEYAELLFPSGWEKLLSLFEVFRHVMIMNFIEEMTPEKIQRFVDVLFENPGAAEMMKFCLAEAQRQTRSDDNARAGRSPRSINKAKVQAIRFYEEGTWKSAAAAAKIIFQKISSDMDTYSPDNAEKTVHNWLLAHNKQKRLDQMRKSPKK